MTKQERIDAILEKVGELNQRRQAAATRVIDALNEIAAASGEIGELGAELKTLEK